MKDENGKLLPLDHRFMRKHRDLSFRIEDLKEQKIRIQKAHWNIFKKKDLDYVKKQIEDLIKAKTEMESQNPESFI